MPESGASISANESTIIPPAIEIPGIGTFEITYTPEIRLGSVDRSGDRHPFEPLSTIGPQAALCGFPVGGFAACGQSKDHAIHRPSTEPYL